MSTQLSGLVVVGGLAPRVEVGNGSLGRYTPGSGALLSDQQPGLLNNAVLLDSATLGGVTGGLLQVLVTLTTSLPAAVLASVSDSGLALVSQTLGTQPVGSGAVGQPVVYGNPTVVGHAVEVGLSGIGGASDSPPALVDVLSTAAVSAAGLTSSAPIVGVLTAPQAAAGGVALAAALVDLLGTIGVTAGGSSPFASFNGGLNTTPATAGATAALNPLGLGFIVPGVDAQGTASNAPLLNVLTLAAAPAGGTAPAVAAVDLVAPAPTTADASVASVTLHVLLRLETSVAAAVALASTVRLGPLPTPLVPTPVATVRLAGRILSPPTLITIAGLSVVGSPVPAASAGLVALPRGTPITLYYAALGAADITWLESLGTVYASLSYGDPLHWSPPVAVVVACAVGAAQLGSDGYQAQVTLTPAMDLPLTTSRWAAQYY